jgi:opacity protein-like surface antigen
MMKTKKMYIILLILSIFVKPVYSNAGTFSVGGFHGFATSAASPALEGKQASYDHTEFKNSFVYGGSFLYRGNSGSSVELCIENLSMDIEEEGIDVGTLKMMPVMLLYKFQGMPKNGNTGFTGHGSIGGGVAFTSFEKGKMLTDLEQENDYDLKITTENSFVFELGAGVDYFITKNFSVNLDGRLLMGNVKTKWADGEMDVDTFQPSNFQVLVGVRYWFR